MARQADRLVGEIRARRRRLQAEVDEIVAGNRLAESVRDRPWFWIAGGTVAGVVLGRIWGGPMLQAGKRHVMAQVKHRAKTTLLGLAAAALGGGASRMASGADSSSFVRDPTASGSARS